MRRSPHSLLVVRILLVSDGLLLAAVAILYGVSGTIPVSVVAGAAAVGLWCLLPLTDPYRRG